MSRLVLVDEKFIKRRVTFARRVYEATLVWAFVWAFLWAFTAALPEADAATLCRIALSRVTAEAEVLNAVETQITLRVGGEPAGVYKYKMLTESSAEVSTFTLQGYRGKGLSRAFATYMLQREQGLREVVGLLVMDNLAASKLLWVTRKISFEECERAVLQTPFVKTFAPMGFSVSECIFNPATKYLSVRMAK